MKDFLLLFRGGDSARMTEQQNDERWQQHMLKWKNWMEGLGKQGKLVGGKPLDKEGSVVRGKNKAITDGPFAESKEVVGGYLLIKANDLKEAVEISKGCPVLEHDGIVEVRAVQEVNM